MKPVYQISRHTHHSIIWRSPLHRATISGNCEMLPETVLISKKRSQPLLPKSVIAVIQLQRFFSVAKQLFEDLIWKLSIRTVPQKPYVGHKYEVVGHTWPAGHQFDTPDLKVKWHIFVKAFYMCLHILLYQR